MAAEVLVDYIYPLPSDSMQLLPGVGRFECRWNSLVFKFLLVVGMLGLSLCGFVNPALAQETWIPDFNAAEHIYLDRRLANDSTHPVQFSNLDRQLAQAEQQHNLKIYVIAAQQGQESFLPDANLAVIKLNELISRWRSNPQFPNSNYLAILWIRRADDANRGWVAANGGTQLQGWGITASHLSNANGPVITALRQYMPIDPQGAIVAIVNNINQEITQAKQRRVEAQVPAQQVAAAQRQQQQAITEAERQQVQQVLAEVERQRQQAQQAAAEAERQQQQQQKRAARQQALLTYAPPAAMGSIALLNIGLITRNFRRKRSRALAAVNQWQEWLNHANQLNLKLYDSYFGFLQLQDDWADRFTGTTLKEYQAAVTDFTNFSVRLEAANQRLQAARQVLKTVRFPFTNGLMQATALLTTESVVITGQELPLAIANLFEDLVTKTSYEPQELLAEMAELFDRTDQGLAKILRAFQGLESSQKALQELHPAIEVLRLTLIQQQLEFEPYEPRLQQICAQEQAFQPLLHSDPLTAYRQAHATQQAAELLKGDLQRSIQLKNSLLKVRSAIDTAADRVLLLRQQTITYQYPGAVDRGVSETYRLAEPNQNPDGFISEAIQHLQAGFRVLLQGELDRAETEMTSAIHASKRTQQLVDATLTAKQFIETQVSIVQECLQQLVAEVPPAIAVMSQLAAEFLPLSFADEANDLQQAQQTIQTTQTALSAIQQAYDQQHYLQGQQLLQPIESTIQTCRDRLQLIPVCLAQLQHLRQHSRQTIEQCQTAAKLLGDKLEAQHFTTSNATATEFEQLRLQLDQQAQQVKQDLADWKTTAAQAEQSLAGLQVLDQAIDQQRSNYEVAQAEVTRLAQAVVAAQAAVHHADTRPTGRELFAQAEAELQSVQVAIAQPQSNWQLIHHQAGKGREIAQAAQQAAQADQAAATAARNAIRRAKSAIASADRIYGYGVRVYLDQERSLLTKAESHFQNRDYEAARQQADRADRDASAAESTARHEVASIEAEIHRQQVEQERARRAAASSSSSSGWSGGGSYGGDSDGGGGDSGGGSY